MVAHFTRLIHTDFIRKFDQTQLHAYLTWTNINGKTYYFNEEYSINIDPFEQLQLEKLLKKTETTKVNIILNHYLDFFKL